MTLTMNGWAQLQAAFSADTTSGCGAISNIQFTDLSSGNPNSWLWNFGNGNTSTLQNPTASYASPGTYTVSLQVSNGSGTDQTSKNNFIVVYKEPAARMTVGTQSGCPPLPVQFTSTSTPGDGPINSYVWDFGDGSPAATSPNPMHIYQTGGSYPVSLQIRDQNGCTDNTLFNSINVSPAPIASFSSINSRFSCTAPYTVNFSNSSSGSNLSYFWDFGDGNTSTQQNPSHSYQNFGSYTVSLRVNDPNCNQTLSKNDFVQISSLSADFDPGPDTLCFGTTFQPSNNSIGASLYSWNFGDGKTSTLENPSHQYADSGTYVVRLIASNGPACIEQIFDTIYVQRVLADFTSSGFFACNPDDSIVLTASGTNIDSLSWAKVIGLGSPSFDNPVNVFHSIEGYFSDTLVAYSHAGCSTIVAKDSNRLVRFMDVRISPSKSSGCEPLKVSFNYSAFGPDTLNAWDWRFGNGDSSLLKNPDSVTYLSAGSYSIVLNSSTPMGCRAVANTILQVGTRQNPDFSLLFDTLCISDSIRVIDLSTDTSIIESITYLVLSDSTDQGPLIAGDTMYFSNFADTGYFAVEVEVIDRGCKVKKRVDSAFYVDGPFVSAGYVPNCINRLEVQFNSIIKGATRFYWNFGDGSPLDSVNRFPLHTFPNAQVYQVTLSGFNDNNTCENSASSFFIDLSVPPPVTAQSILNDICVGNVFQTGYSPFSLYNSPQWIIGSDTLSDSIVFIDTIRQKGETVIELAVVDNLGCPHKAYDTIRGYAPEANFYSDLRTGCLPLSVQFFDSSLTDTSLKTWRWDFGNQRSSGSQNDTSTYHLPGQYAVSLFVENEFGCVDSIQKLAYVETEALEADFIQGTTSICQGESINFRNTSVGNGLSAQWNFGDGTALDTNFTTAHVFPNAGIFSIQLIVQNQNGCSDTLTKVNLIDVQAKPIADFTSDTSRATCYPLAVNFQDQSTGNVISWDWDFGDGSKSVFQNPFHNYTLPGQYTVRLIVETSNGCRDTIVKTNFIQTQGPLADFTMDRDSICINESVNFALINAQNVFSFFWDFGDGSNATGNTANHVYTQTGTLFPTLILSDSTGQCIIPLKDTLFVQPVQAEFSMSDTLACGIPFQVDFTNQSIGATQWLWTIAGNTFTASNPSFTFSNYGTYDIQLSIQSDLACQDSESKQLLVSPKPIPVLRGDTGICPGDSLALLAGGGTRYLWKPNRFISDVNAANVLVYPDSSQNYNVLVYNVAGCVDSAQIQVAVPRPPLNFELLDTNLIIGESLSINAFAGLLFNYQWSPPDGISCLNCPNPVFQPLKTTQYYLRVFDSFGCFSIQDSLLIEIKEAYSLAVPSAFSPNGDGSNDLIKVRGWGLKELLAFKIYNRYGELVYEGNDFEEGWDGTYKSKPQAMETYVYTVEALTFGGEVLRKKGNISLIR